MKKTSLSDFINNFQQHVDARDIPWSDPDFSRRILKDQLNPDNDIAGRRASAIARFVGFIHHHLLGGKPTRIMDLGCGPGLYSHGLAKFGNRCIGIDISPAAIEYARKIADNLALNCTFRKENFQNTDLGKNFGLVMLTFGDFNSFSRQIARQLLGKIVNTIKTDGMLLLEVLTDEGVINICEREPGWTILQSGMFSDKPYLFLDKYLYNKKTNTAEADYYVIHPSGQVEHYRQSYTRYSDDDYQQLLLQSGFKSVEFYPGFGLGSHDFADDLQIIVARK
ncbi:MAG: hypothetical protein DRP96_07320 [Candidatus Neomarinimicrobiota bacterium]|nr:MAG: hypothetical protein DRP96_07320 [Candidatus Neomarinimicrobiota bacterium]